MLQIPTDLGSLLRQVHDRRSMVVLPLLDSGIHIRRLWFLFGYQHRPTPHLRALCNHNAFHLWWETADYHHEPDRQRPVCSTHASHVHLRLVPVVGTFRTTPGQLLPIIIIGIAGAAHQSWSANIYSVVGDMFPKNTIATIVGIGGLAGGIGSVLINMGSGVLFDYAQQTQMSFMGFTGKPAGYFIIFCVCAVAYLLGWCIMKSLVPKYKLVEV